MARGYLDALTAQYSSQGIVTRDLNYREAWDFHSRYFAAHGLPADAWALNSVFNVMANDAIRECYWIEILSTAGNPAAELAILVKTENFMATASVIGTPEVKALAQNWRSRVDTPSTFAAAANGTTGMIGDQITKFFEEISNAVLGHVPAGTVIPTWAPVSFPTPSPAVQAPAAAAPIPAAPQSPAPPVRRRRKGNRGLPPPTTYQGHPGSGYGQTSSGSTGPRLTLY